MPKIGFAIPTIWQLLVGPSTLYKRLMLNPDIITPAVVCIACAIVKAWAIGNASGGWPQLYAAL